MNFLSSALKKLTTSGGFVPEKLSFSEDGSLSVVTTALLAEGGYSYVYSAREVSVSPQQFAAKKVLAQDKDTCSVAEVETKVRDWWSGVAAVFRRIVFAAAARAEAWERVWRENVRFDGESRVEGRASIDRSRTFGRSRRG